jgi:kynurenine formamidase
MLIDLSHTIATGMQQVATLPPVDVCRVSAVAEGARTNGQALRMSGHSGTHIDAPLHVFDGLASIDAIEAQRFVGPGVALSVRKEPCDPVSAADLEAAARGLLRAGDMVLIHTGWDRFYGDPVYLTDYPSFTLEAADWLIERQVKLVALDMLSPDLPSNRRPPDAQLVVHRRLLGNDVLIAENLTGIGAVAGHRLQVHALPLKIAEGDGAPSRFCVEIVDA